MHGHLAFSRKGKTVYVHRLVYESVYGKIPRGCHIHHVDGNRLNNEISNLQLLTIAEHMRLEKIGNDYRLGKSIYGFRDGDDRYKTWFSRRHGTYNYSFSSLVYWYYSTWSND
jgi:hypothetical protein